MSDTSFTLFVFLRSVTGFEPRNCATKKKKKECIRTYYCMHRKMKERKKYEYFSSFARTSSLDKNIGRASAVVEAKYRIGWHATTTTTLTRFHDDRKRVTLLPPPPPLDTILHFPSSRVVDLTYQRTYDRK